MTVKIISNVSKEIPKEIKQPRFKFGETVDVILTHKHKRKETNCPMRLICHKGE